MVDHNRPGCTSFVISPCQQALNYLLSKTFVWNIALMLGRKSVMLGNLSKQRNLFPTLEAMCINMTIFQGLSHNCQDLQYVSSPLSFLIAYMWKVKMFLVRVCYTIQGFTCTYIHALYILIYSFLYKIYGYYIWIYTHTHYIFIFTPIYVISTTLLRACWTGLA